jgi:GGDEF domain-containing protein
MLPIGIIAVLGAGMALLMYPVVFGTQAVPAARPSPTLFFGFCALCILVILYLVNRQYVVRKLYTRLAEERKEIAHIREKASADLLGSLPGFTHFQDRLTMGLRRATQTGEPLSMILVLVKPAPMFDSTAEVSVGLGDSARVLSGKLRAEDSLYRLAPRVFGVVLPNAGVTEVAHLGGRIAEGLTDASGVSSRFSFDIRVVTYPENVSSAYEMEQLAASFSPQD